MAVAASSRGWGHIGSPGSAAGKQYGRANIATLKVGGVALPVHKEVAPLFKVFIERIVARGYRLDKVKDDWGYIHRYIAGTKTLSNHSWGLAVDLNATTNPMTTTLITDMPPWVIGIATECGLDWGGYYRGRRKDPMHFEFLGTPAEAREISRRLAAGPVKPVPGFPDIEEEPMQARQIPKTGRFPNGRVMFMNVTPEGRAIVYNDITALDGKSDVHKGDCVTQNIQHAGIIGWDFLTRTADGSYYGYVMFANDGGTFTFQ